MELGWIEQNRAIQKLIGQTSGRLHAQVEVE